MQPEQTFPANRRRAVDSKRMKLTIKRGATIEDLEATPEGVNGQLIDGDLFTTTRPSNAHAAAITELLLALGPFTRDRKLGWVVLFEPEVLYG